MAALQATAARMLVQLPATAPPLSPGPAWPQRLASEEGLLMSACSRGQSPEASETLTTGAYQDTQPVGAADERGWVGEKCEWRPQWETLRALLR